MQRMEPSPSPRRFFALDLIGDVVALPAVEAHHAAKVLRLKAGAKVELFDGRGGRACGNIAECAKNCVDVAIAKRFAAAERPRPCIHLAFAIPKGKRLDWLLEKTTELGAASLQPVRFARSVAGDFERFSTAKRDRWEAHGIAAAKQSGQCFLPEIRPPVDLKYFLSQEHEAQCLLGDTDCEAVSVAKLLPSPEKPNGDVLVLVGPEGGLTADERTEAMQAGFASVRLGCTTLRIETAAVALIAAILAVWDAAAPLSIRPMPS